MYGAITLPAGVENRRELRDLVVTQDYAQYSAQDQAVWRFVLTHTHRRLLARAHAAYAGGFAASGITTQRIPRIAEISERLSAIGWSAVCVDGFIPPRAFQAFQAHRVLPIAADMRTRKHLTYTPAPDIVHEAAGHAPFLSEPEYARYLTRIGQVGSHAFSTPSDRALYEAIYMLSEVKENPASSALDHARAQRTLDVAIAAQGEPSEAARLARLYWWTVEYGLCGTVEDYRLYGAGLLSSIGEGYFCDDPNVAKRPLTAACVDVGYDITRPQPQLFVARDFAHLSEVLDEVTTTLGQHLGGMVGLGRAQQSAELATLTLDSGVQIAGYVQSASAFEHEPSVVQLQGPCAIAREGEPLGPLQGVELTQTCTLVLGHLADGTALGELHEAALQRHVDTKRALDVTLRGGMRVTGRLECTLTSNGRVQLAVLSELRVMRGDEELLRSNAPYPWLFGTRLPSVRAGGLAGHELTSRRPSVRVPKPRVLDTAETEMLALYQEGAAAVHALQDRVQQDSALSAIERVRARLDAAWPNEWLLRYELLAGLIDAGVDAAQRARLTEQLVELEARYAEREPIATGLAYLRAREQEHAR